MSKFQIVFALLMMLAWQPVFAQSPQQQVRIVVSSLEGGKYEASVFYRTSDQSLTTGIGFNLHYQTGLISNISTIDILGIPAGNQTLVDTSDLDSDPSTDGFIRIAWVEFGSANFPEGSTEETLLYKLAFDLADPSTISNVKLNFSSPSLASGYTFSAENFSILLPVPVPSAPSANALSTNNATPTLSGAVTLAAGESLSVTVNGVTYATASGVSVDAGLWSLSIPSALPDGSYQIVATVTNSVNVSASGDTELVIDTTAPVVPTVDHKQQHPDHYRYCYSGQRRDFNSQRRRSYLHR